MFLDEFDHLMKEKYRLKYYGRYMDDFYVILSDKQRLKEILKDIRALMDGWGLELNQKTGIFPLRTGIDSSASIVLTGSDGAPETSTGQHQRTVRR